MHVALSSLTYTLYTRVSGSSRAKKEGENACGSRSSPTLTYTRVGGASKWMSLKCLLIFICSWLPPNAPKKGCVSISCEERVEWLETGRFPPFLSSFGGTGSYFANYHPVHVEETFLSQIKL